MKLHRTKHVRNLLDLESLTPETLEQVKETVKSWGTFDEDSPSSKPRKLKRNLRKLIECDFSEEPKSWIRWYVDCLDLVNGKSTHYGEVKVIDATGELKKESLAQEIKNALAAPESLVPQAFVGEDLDALVEMISDLEAAKIMAQWVLGLYSNWSNGSSEIKSEKELLKLEGLSEWPQGLDAMKAFLKAAYIRCSTEGYRFDLVHDGYAEKTEQRKKQLMNLISSSTAADYCLTIKVYPSSDKTLNQDVAGHGSVPKVAVTADINWMSSYSQLILQYNDWAAVMGEDGIPANFGDVIFVQNLKDSFGRETAVTVLNRTILALDGDYIPVTPGFWVKRNHPFADWVRNVFETNQQVRARSRSMATTPCQYGTDVDANGKSVLHLAADFSKLGFVHQKDGDGANIVSADYNLKWSGWIGQARQHTGTSKKYHDYFVACKGLFRRHRVWAALETLNGDATKIKIGWDKAAIEAYGHTPVPIVLWDIENIKGTNSSEIKAAVADLEQEEAIVLNTWSLKKDVRDTWSAKAEKSGSCRLSTLANVGRMFGGILAEDNPGRGWASTSWQQYQLFCPRILSVVEEHFRDNVRKKFDKMLDGGSSEFLMGLFRQTSTVTTFASAAQSQREMNQRRVEKFVLGMDQEWATNYVDQMAMPSGFAITQNRHYYSKATRSRKLAMTAQPQLYHGCMRLVEVLTHKDIDRMVSFISGDLQDVSRFVNGQLVVDYGMAKYELSDSSIKFLKQWELLIKAEDVSLSDEDIYNIILGRLWFIQGSFGERGVDTLVWISKKDADATQSDSDGDRLLFSWRERDIVLVRMHREATSKLPVPKIEVKGIPKDGSGAYQKMTQAEWGSETDKAAQLEAAKFLCAPDQGRGPVGILVNQCSAILNLIPWEERKVDEGNHGTASCQWLPREDIMESVFKLYHFWCLLIQNAIDRPKNPHEVAALKQLFSLDLSKVIDRNNRYDISTPDNAMEWPKLVMGKPVTKLKERLDWSGMYNTPVLKHVLAWAMNEVLWTGRLANNEHWISRLSDLATEFERNVAPKNETPAQRGEREERIWSRVAAIYQSDSTWEEIRDGFVMPDGLYDFKNGIVIDSPLENAAPGLTVISEWVSEEYLESKKEAGLEGDLLLTIYHGLSEAKVAGSESPTSLWNNNYGTVGQRRAFLQELRRVIVSGRGEDRRLRGQSELISNRKLSTAAENLRELKEAIDYGGIDFPQGNIFSQAFNSSVKDKGDASYEATHFLARCFQEFFLEWADTNRPVTAWAYLAFQGKLDDWIWSADHIETLKEDSPEAKLALLLSENDVPVLQDSCDKLVQWLKDYWLRKQVVGSMPQGAAWTPTLFSHHMSRVVKIKDGDWLTAVFQEWIPALEEHQKLSKDNDLIRRYYLGDKGEAKETIQFILGEASSVQDQLDNSTWEGLVSRKTGPAFEMEMKEKVEKMKMLCNAWLESNDRESEFLTTYQGHYLHWVWTNENFSREEKCERMYGLAVELGLAEDPRNTFKILRPVIQAGRIKTWLNNAYARELRQDQINDLVRSALLSSFSYTRLDPVTHEPVLMTSYSLKGRPDVMVPVHHQVQFFEEILKNGLSVYALAPTLNMWVNWKGSKIDPENPLGNKFSQSWVYYDSRLRHSDAYSVVSLREEFEANMAHGDIFSVTEVNQKLKAFKRGSYTGEDAARADRAVAVLEQKLIDEAQYVRLVRKGLDEMEKTDPKQRIEYIALRNDVCIPMHWGGNDKAFSQFPSATTRTSAHRPIWRFVMAVHGLNADKETSFGLYNALGGSTCYSQGRSVSAIEASDIKNAEDLVARAPSFSQGHSSYTRPDRPWSTPGQFRAVLEEGTIEWVKIARSPTIEPLGSILIVDEHGRVAKVVMLLDQNRRFIAVREDEDNLIGDWAEALVNENPSLREFALEGGPRIHRHMVLTGYKNLDIKKVNGVNAPGIVAENLLELDVGTDGERAELLLGLRNITGILDSFVLANWDAKTKQRFMGKGPKAWKAFMKSVAKPEEFDISYPKNYQEILLKDFFGRTSGDEESGND